jgi:FAD/FMN-containing dehydrogenase/Fe-S oxidoreductase
VKAVQICRRRRCPITMRGGGTSQAGQAIGPGLMIDTSRYFNRLIEVNAAERWARVEPGLVLDELNAALAPHGLRFAPDISTASRATVGGMMANNSSGARSVVYGKTIDHVLEQQVVLSDGSVAWLRSVTDAEAVEIGRGTSLEAACYREVRRIARANAAEIERRYPKVLRRVGGYNLDAFVDPDGPFNLAKLMVGSEGTLGIVVEARLNLVPLPKAKGVLAVQFDGLLDALEAVPAILRHGPSAVEVMDRFILDHTRQSSVLDRLRRTFIDGDPEALLCVEFYGSSADDVRGRLQALEADLRASGRGGRLHRAESTAEQRTIWSLREAALGLSMAMRGDAKSMSFVEDTAVAPERLRNYIDELLTIVRRHGTTAGVYAHASVGCLHVRPVVNLKTEAGVRQFEAIASDVADLVLAYGGALSGEHGDGLVRSPFMERMFGPELYSAFREVKKAFDPDGLFNPGKIVDSPPLSANLRYGAGYRTAEPATFFDFREDEGVHRAAEMCSGLGACRKTLDGTMCPSYMATRDERHSTRGRANVLRLAMAGQIGQAGLADEAVRDVLELCLECRACKAECPVGVDVARLKSEFLASYWARHGTPLRARALGHVHAMAAWGSRVAPLANAILRSAPARWAAERFVGLDRRRPAPPLARDTFVRRTRERRMAPAHADVLVFNDTFTNHYNPGIGIAALTVLDRLGVSSTLAPNVCCGRPLISQGLLGEARQAAQENTDRLFPLVRSGRPLLFLEPSCLSAVVEDAPALLRGDARLRAEGVARAAMLVEEWIERDGRIGRAMPPLRSGPRRILVHGHCHQRAMARLSPVAALLGRIPDASVVDLDAGCCGMAGSFGYLRGHYDVSRAIAERRLLPAARTMGSGDVLVAGGVSCRHQVADLASVRALHPIELIASLLGDPA